MASQHEALVDAILLDIGSKPWARCWRTQVGTYRYLYRNGIVTVGPKGKPDIEGLLWPYGRAFYIEVKVGRDKQRDTQIAFQRMAERMGALYIVARTVEMARSALQAERLKTDGRQVTHGS